MNYLQKKRFALMMNRNFRGYLRTVNGNPATLSDCKNDYPAIISVCGNTHQGNPEDNCLDILDVWDNPDGTLWSQYKYKYIKLKPNTAYTLSTNAPTTTTTSGSTVGLFYIYSGKRTSTWLWSYPLAGVASDESSETWCTDSEGYLTIMLHCSVGDINVTRESLIDGTYWVMLNEGETALEYKPYAELSSTNPQELYSCGNVTENLADQSNVCRGASDVAYPNRTPYGYVLDNSVNRISGMPCRIEQGKTYTCSYNTEYITGDLSCSTFYIKNSEEGLMQYLQNGKSFVANFDATFLGIYVALGEGETNSNTGEIAPLTQIKISEVMLNEGDTALPYEPYGQYKIPVEQSGNLYNVQDKNTTIGGQGAFSVDEEDYISLEKDNSSGTSSAYNSYYTQPSSKIKSNRLYTIITEIKELNNCTLTVTSNSIKQSQFKTNASYTSAGIYKAIVVSQEDVTKYPTMLRTEVTTKAGCVGNVAFRISVFEGELSTAVEEFEYQPYREGAKYNIYAPKCLSGNSDVYDMVTLDIDNKRAIFSKKYSEIEFDGTESGWIKNESNSNGICSYQITLDCKKSEISKCTHFKSQNYTDIETGDIGFVALNKMLLFRVLESEYPTVEDFKMWLADEYAAGTPVKVIYQTEKVITDDISIVQNWENISELNDGINIITVDIDIPPSDISVTYYPIN